MTNTSVEELKKQVDDYGQQLARMGVKTELVQIIMMAKKLHEIYFDTEAPQYGVSAYTLLASVLHFHRQILTTDQIFFQIMQLLTRLADSYSELEKVSKNTDTLQLFGIED